MRSLGKCILSLGAVSLLATPALAQQGRGGFGGGMMGGPALLANPGVQKELKLDDDQVKKAQDFADDFGQKMRGRMQDLQDVPQEERREKMTAIMTEMNADAQKELKGILKPEQLKRFDQISLQARGPQAFTDAEVQKKLNITADQKSKLADIQQDQMEQQRDIFQNAGDDRQAAMQKMTDLRKQTREKMMNVLSAEQKTTWKEMTGEPFEVQMQPRRRPGGN